MDGKAGCITINCGCCGNGGTTPTLVTGDGTPIGTVNSYMGTKAPQHYLICDGTIFKIADYPQLSQQIQESFGATDYFGGDGTTTFAVPDLRNEFLRGYHGDAAEQLSDGVGIHQKATQIPYFHMVTASGAVDVYGDSSNTYSDVINADKDYAPAGLIVRAGISGIKGGTSAVMSSFASRPTNIAVLYCIKYE